MNDSDFLGELARAEVVTRGNYLKAGKGVAVVKSFKRDQTRDGDAAILELLIIKVQPKGNEPANTVGEVAAKMYMFEKGDKDKRAATFANFKRDACAIDGVDPKTIKPERLATIVKEGVPDAKTGKHSAYVGMLLAFDSYGGTTKKGEARTYHNLTSIQQSPQDVAKRAKLIAAGADASQFL